MELFATTLGPVSGDVRRDPTLSSVQWTAMDVTEDHSVESVLEETVPEVVCHLAGQSSVGESFDDPLSTWEVNATGTYRLVLAMASMSRRPNRLVVVSSAEVYGVAGSRGQLIGESAPLHPVTPYGVSKAAAELASIQVGRSSGIEVIIARSFNHIGPGQDGRFVLPSVARQLARVRRGEGEPLVMTGNLEVTRDFLDVRDVARGYRRLIEVGAAGAIYNVCSGTSRSLQSVVRRMIELSETGARLEIDPERMRSVDIGALVGDPSAILRLGWAPEIGLDETLVDLLEEAGAGG